MTEGRRVFSVDGLKIQCSGTRRLNLPFFVQLNSYAYGLISLGEGRFIVKKLA